VTELLRRNSLLLLRGASSKVSLRKGRVMVFEHLDLHTDIRLCLQIQMMHVRLGICGGCRSKGGGYGPRLGVVTRLQEKFVKRDFYRWADNVKRVGGRNGVAYAFSVVHRIRNSGDGT
jgi:hypothetical protein